MMRRASAAFAAVVASLLMTTPAWAAPSTEIVQGRYLRLVSVADWDAAHGMLPGESVPWEVTISADAPEPGEVQIGISATGQAPLVVGVDQCDQPWVDGICASGAQELRAHGALPRDGESIGLMSMPTTEVAHLRLSVALGADARGTTQVRVHADGSGESLAVGPGDDLATTGLSPAVPWILGGGAALLLVGGALLATRRRRTDDEEKQ